MADRRAGNATFAASGTGRRWEAFLPIMGHPDYVVSFEDFTGVSVDASRWTEVKDSGASVGIVADTVNGEAILSSAANTDNDGSSLQGNETWLPAAGRTMWFETRVKLSDADQMDACLGLTVNFASDPEAMLAAPDRICLQINDDDATVFCKTEAGGTETSTETAIDLLDATYIRLGFRVTGTGLVQFYVNRNLVATHTTNIPTTELAVGMMELSGVNTGTKTMTLDYVMVGQTR